eukprot:s1809_g4.t2
MKRPAAAHAPEPPAKKGKTGKGEEKEKEDEEEAGQEDESDMQGQSTSKAGNNKRKGKQPGRKKEEPQEEEQENPEEEEQEEQQEEEQENPEEEEEQTEEDVGTSPKLEPQAAGYLLRRPFVVLALAYNRFVFFGLSASLYLSLSPLFNRSCTCQVERGLKEMRAIAAKDKRFQFGSGNFYITGLRKEILDKVNKEKLCDHVFEDSTGKANFQKSKAKPLRADTQETVVETPPQRFRAKSANASHSHDKSKAPKRCLSAELKEAAAPPNKKLINLGPSNPAPKKKTNTPEDKKKEQEEAKQAAYEMKDHATATSSADPMPGASKLSKKASPKAPKAKATPAAKKKSSPAATKTKDSTAPPAEKPTETPTQKSTPPAHTTEQRQPKKTRTKSPEKNPSKTRGRSPPSDSPQQNPKKARLKQYLVLIEDEEVDESTDEIEELFCMEQKGQDSSSDGSEDITL